MTERMNLRQQECVMLQQQVENYHEEQLDRMRAGIKKLYDLLSRGDGFHAQQTSAKITLVLEQLEGLVEAEITKLFRDTETCVERLVDLTMAKDQENG